MWVPELPFQLACQREGSLRERPLAFLSPQPGRTPALWLVNRLAKAAGVAPGDPMDQALRRLPGLRVLDPAPQTWWEAQASLGDFLSRWSPQGLLGRMGEALLELRGTHRLFGPPQDAAIRIQRELASSVGWASHGGLSQSATAARLAAHLERSLELVDEGSEQTFLAPQPLVRLPDLTPRIQWRFHRLGLRRFGDLQPVPLPTLAQLMPEPEARRVLAQARGEDRPRLPLLADAPGESRHPWRLEPPRLPEEVFLASWCLERLWSEGRSPRTLALRWWDVDGARHQWTAAGDDLALPPLELVQVIERAFRRLSTRRILVHRLELHMAWGLGRARSLFEPPRTAKLGALEVALARLRRRYPQTPVLPGWALTGGQSAAPRPEPGVVP
jgi:hypothetical protein